MPLSTFLLAALALLGIYLYRASQQPTSATWTWRTDYDAQGNEVGKTRIMGPRKPMGLPVAPIRGFRPWPGTLPGGPPEVQDSYSRTMAPFLGREVP